MKKCTACKKYLDESNFWNYQRAPDNLMFACKTCSQKRVSRWRKENVDQYRAYQRNYHQNLTDEQIMRKREAHKRWYQKNKKRILAERAHKRRYGNEIKSTDGGAKT